MRWQAALLCLIAALALPVVGLVTGRVVGDFFLEVFAPRSSRGDMIGAVGAGFGVLVYALALASSYSHLRHYYRGYEAQGVRASWALALAVEVATFYMSFAYVVIHSPWAFWGSLIGALVVFWGNFSSMYEARIERAGDTGLRGEAARQPARASVVAASPVGEHLEVRPVTLPTQEGHEAPSKGPDFPLSEVDREVLRLAAAGPVGPSSVSRVLGIAKSSAGDRLRRLERLGLLVKQGSSYVVAAEGSTMRRTRSI